MELEEGGLSQRINKNMKIQKFCRYCGKGMIGKYKMVGYDVDSGQKIQEIIWKCPDKKWYNFCDNFITEEDGRWRDLR